MVGSVWKFVAVVDWDSIQPNYEYTYGVVNCVLIPQKISKFLCFIDNCYYASAKLV